MLSYASEAFNYITELLLRFDQNVEYKRPAGTYPLRDFHTSCRVCTSFHAALAIKNLLDLLEGLWSYGNFKLTGSREWELEGLHAKFHVNVFIMTASVGQKPQFWEN